MLRGTPRCATGGRSLARRANQPVAGWLVWCSAVVASKCLAYADAAAAGPDGGSAASRVTAAQDGASQGANDTQDSEDESATGCPIDGSEAWRGCEHDGMSQCGLKCCCAEGMTYDAEELACVPGPCPADESSSGSFEEMGCPIDGSDAWQSCHHEHIYECGGVCCCVAGYVYSAASMQCLPGECGRDVVPAAAARPCPIEGSEAWSTCEHDGMSQCGPVCCCGPGTVYDAATMRCVLGQCPAPSAAAAAAAAAAAIDGSGSGMPCPIVGSEEWKSCEHDDMAVCGEVCCCSPGFIYDPSRLACVVGDCPEAIGDVLGDSEEEGCEIRGSEAWSSCNHEAMQQCGEVCCCDQGLVYNENTVKCQPGDCPKAPDSDADFSAGCPILGSDAWESCQHEQMGECGALCCCVPGSVYDINATACVPGKCPLGGCPIQGSQSWQTCDHPSRKIHLCMDSHDCCCEPGFAYDATALDCKARVCPAYTEQLLGCPIPASDVWESCSQDNMERCGAYCCCHDGFAYSAQEQACVAGSCGEASLTLLKNVCSIPGSATWESCGRSGGGFSMLKCGDECCCGPGLIWDASGTEGKCVRGECSTNTVAEGCTEIPGSDSWKSCSHDNMATRGSRCCCADGTVYDTKTLSCVDPENVSEPGAPIIGSEDWTSCVYDNMQTCADRCCCSLEYAYDSSLEACVPIEERHVGPQTEAGEIKGSENWYSCWHSNVQRCGGKCCCEEGLIYVQFDDDHAQCLPSAVVPKFDFGKDVGVLGR
eukprot:TRINITY_DN12267_c0_g1_i1.p1 TRINITY_DN12267_c0_g1~~TRINITY_DN12267_c0_g1_i1.p1  ORF type:complete len:764 (-),score=130.61 TRINITY_DN12267_c0_g1_i1:82-2373(-)